MQNKIYPSRNNSTHSCKPKTSSWKWPLQKYFFYKTSKKKTDLFLRKTEHRIRTETKMSSFTTIRVKWNTLDVVIDSPVKDSGDKKAFL